MAKVGILGGTFDPPHIGHLIIADQVLHALSLDEIRFMPNYYPPHKEKQSSTTVEDRLMMIKLAISGHPHFRIETIELERKEKSYTYDTMVLLQEKEPNNEFFFIIGGDMIDYLPNWHRIDELVQIVQFVGVKRPNYASQTNYPIQYVETPEIYLSSSMIREKINQHGSIKYLVPDSVINYIEENQLYGKR